MFDNLTNLAYGIVATPPVPDLSGTQFYLMPGQGTLFTANQPVTMFPAGLAPTHGNAEIGYITDLLDDRLTVLREQEGTNAKPITAGWSVVGGPTAKTFADITAAVQAKADVVELTDKVSKTANNTIIANLTVDGSQASKEIYLKSSQAGGRGYSGNDLDTTSRITLESYQTNGPSGAGNDGFMGEILRVKLKDPRAKAMMSYYAPRTAINTRNAAYHGKDRAIVWLGAHELAQDQPDIENPTVYHNHWSVETPDYNDQLRTRFSVDFDDKTDGKIGTAYTTIYTNLATMAIYAENDQTLRIFGGQSHNRDIEFNILRYGGRTTKRFWLRLDTGDNFRIMRRQSADDSERTVMFFNRTNGRTLVGDTNLDGTLVTGETEDAQFAVGSASGGQHVMILRSTASMTAAGKSVLLAKAISGNDRLIATSVGAETTNRVVVNMSGRFEWGDGTLSRDTFMYRNGVAELKTDGALTVGGALSTASLASASLDITGLATSTRATDGVGFKVFQTTTNASPSFLAEAAGSGGTAIQFKVTGETVNRFSSNHSGKLEWGSGSATRDTNLYRKSAGVLSSDHKLTALLGIGVGNSAAGTTLGALSKKMEVFDAAGASLGFVPIYTTIT